MKNLNMKFGLLIALGIGLAALPSRAAEEKSDFKTQREKLSYAYGLNYGQAFKRQESDIDPDVLAKAIKDVLSGATLRLTEKEARETIMAYQKELRAKQEEKNKALAEQNKKDGAAFLAENAKKEGVKATASGLQYKILTEGTGETPKASDSVVTQYRGTLIDGKEFDSSYKRGQPATFSVTGVIKGWTEALQMMKTGAKWQLFIPSDLAYGDRGTGRDIPPGATLIFELELLSIKPAGTPPALPGTGAATTTAQPVTSDIIKVPSAEELKKGAKIEVIKADSVEKK